ncbi:MAG: RNA pseudouridine synthase [Desulfatitalea sp.]|nr:RNA pseudouridine synthase [Desulfatitalea sp.]
MQRGPDDKPNLVDLAKLWIKTRYAKPGRVFAGMVHRLDGPVAGVLALARTSKAAARLCAQFREGGITKTYLAVVQGTPPQTSARLVHQLVRVGRLSRIAPPGSAEGQTAALSYRLVDREKTKSLLEVTLETGRRHQIRAQLAAMGCPIWGDRSYGAEQALPDGRIALLGARLRLTHPTRSLPMSFETPWPQGWPWPCPSADLERPLWTIEELYRHGLVLPRSAPQDEL